MTRAPLLQKPRCTTRYAATSMQSMEHPMSTDAGTVAPAPGRRYTGATVTDKISELVLVRPMHWGFMVGFALASALTLLLLVAISYLFARGVGIWGVNQPVA